MQIYLLHTPTSFIALPFLLQMTFRIQRVFELLMDLLALNSVV